MLREGGITAGGDRGEAGLVIQSAAVDGGGDMIFHCRRKSCGAESGTKLGGSRRAAVDSRRGLEDHRLILRMNLSVLCRVIASNEPFFISTTTNEQRGLRRGPLC